MLDLGSTDFYIKVPSMPRDELEAYSSRIFDLWEARVAQELTLEDYALTLEIEEGSIKGSGKIKTGLKALFYVVCGYGSLVQGLQTIRSHVSSAGDYLSEMAQNVLGPDQPAPIVRKKSGTIGQLQRLFVKVQCREMTVDEAISEAKILVEEEASESSEFMVKLTEALKDTQLHPQQINLPLDGLDEAQAPEEKGKDENPRTPRPKPAIPPSNQLRVEIWKESKHGKKKVRVINL
jgi:hypothetical protein